MAVFGPIVNQVRESSQTSPRTGSICRMIWHHQAGTNDDYAIRMAVERLRQLSMTYSVSNEGRITGVASEDRRPWTSSSVIADGRALTAEVENRTGAPTWEISDAAHEACARIAAYAYERYGVPLKRATKADPTGHLGHREVLGMFGQGYSTSCPFALDINRIIERARELVGQPGGGIVPATGGGGVTGPVGGGVDYGYGLTREAQLAIQEGLHRIGLYNLDRDGVFGPGSVSALQQWLKLNGFLDPAYDVDGVPGPVYGEALHDLADQHGYTGTHEGLPGANVSAALIRWAGHLQDAQPQPEWSYWEPTGALARRVQQALKNRGRYSGAVDGVFGPLTRKGVQLSLRGVGYTGPIDGDIREVGCELIQLYARRFGSYTGPIDKAPREASWTGFALGLERP